MYLRSLELSNFRNFQKETFEFSPGINIIYGPNASGKTNLLEAIYTLSNLRSFRTHTFRDLIHWGKTQAHVRGVVQQQDPQKTSIEESGADFQTGEREDYASVKKLAVGIEPNARVLLINSKRCKSSREYLRILPTTAFIPDDLSLVKGAPASRRYFLDRGTFQYYPPYWSLLTEYNKILRQKNALLRELKNKISGSVKGTETFSSGYPRGDPCEVWNTQLQGVGSKIILQRIIFVRNLQKCSYKIYDTWLDSEENIHLRYTSSIRFTSEDFPELSNSEELNREKIYEHIFETYGKAIERNTERERQLGMTIVGPHRDDLNIKFSGRSLRAFGSQGQQRTAVLALKFAELSLYFERYTEYSILLLDDVTSELDANRNNKLFEYLQHGMQVFISTTSKPEFFTNNSVPCTYFNLSKNGIYRDEY